MRRSLVLCAILGIGLTSVWVHAAQQAAAPAQAFNPANFTGTVTPHSTADIRMNRYGKGITQVSLSFGMTSWKEAVGDRDYKQ